MQNKFFYNLLICLIEITFIGCSGGDSSNSIDDSLCDNVVDKGVFEICYNYEYKGAIAVKYSLSGSLVNSVNIEIRPDFYSETTIPSEYRSSANDYSYSGYDRGHLASDTSFDYDQNTLYKTYSMANIAPQKLNLNRYVWGKTEEVERAKAVEFGSVDVYIGLEYTDNPLRIGANGIAVPKAFYKKISNSIHNYEKCYYYENIDGFTDNDTIDSYLKNCNDLTFYSSFSIYIPPPINTSSGNSFSCNVSKTCTSMSNCNEAYYYLNSCGKTSLDRDKDGIPCETICN